MCLLTENTCVLPHRMTKISPCVFATPRNFANRPIFTFLSPFQIPFGRLLMQHVRERCVLLRACWRVRVGASLLTDFTGHTPALTAVNAVPPQHELTAAAAAAVVTADHALAASEELVEGGLKMKEAEASDGGGGVGHQFFGHDVTYGRTVTIVCDGQVFMCACVRACVYVCVLCVFV